MLNFPTHCATCGAKWFINHECAPIRRAPAQADKPAGRGYSQPMTTRVYLACLETSNYMFDGCGSTPEAARVALEHGLRVHAGQLHLVSDWWVDCADDIHVRTLECGAAYRDSEVLR